MLSELDETEDEDEYEGEDEDEGEDWRGMTGAGAVGDSRPRVGVEVVGSSRPRVGAEVVGDSRPEVGEAGDSMSEAGMAGGGVDVVDTSTGLVVDLVAYASISRLYRSRSATSRAMYGARASADIPLQASAILRTAPGGSFSLPTFTSARRAAK